MVYDMTNKEERIYIYNEWIFQFLDLCKRQVKNLLFNIQSESRQTGEVWNKLNELYCDIKYLLWREQRAVKARYSDHVADSFPKPLNKIQTLSQEDGPV